MSEENKELLRRWFEEVWHKGRTEAIDEMFAGDGLAHGLAEGESMRGPQAFKDFHASFRGAFPDVRVVIEDMVAEDDRVAARCTVTGKHTGDSLGFAATNAPVEFTGMTIVRIRNGQIVEAWNNFDFMNMNRQLGIM